MRIEDIRNGAVVRVDLTADHTSIGKPAAIYLGGSWYSQEDLDRCNAEIVRNPPRPIREGDVIIWPHTGDRAVFIALRSTGQSLVAEGPDRTLGYWMRRGAVHADGTPIDWDNS